MGNNPTGNETYKFVINVLNFKVSEPPKGGSHIKLKHINEFGKVRRVTIPLGNDELPPGTFNNILRELEMRKKDFMKLFKKYK